MAKIVAKEPDIAETRVWIREALSALRSAAAQRGVVQDPEVRKLTLKAIDCLELAEFHSGTMISSMGWASPILVAVRPCALRRLTIRVTSLALRAANQTG